MGLNAGLSAFGDIRGMKMTAVSGDWDARRRTSVRIAARFEPDASNRAQQMPDG